MSSSLTRSESLSECRTCCIAHVCLGLGCCSLLRAMLLSALLPCPQHREHPWSHPRRFAAVAQVLGGHAVDFHPPVRCHLSANIIIRTAGTAGEPHHRSFEGVLCACLMYLEPKALHQHPAEKIDRCIADFHSRHQNR